MTREKVVIVGPAFPLRGGISDFDERLAYALIDAGYDVEIFSFSLQYPSFLFPGKTQFRDGEAPNLTIHSTIHSMNPLSWTRTGRAIKKLKPDLVISKFWIPFLGPSLGKVLSVVKRSGIPVITVLDNVIPHEARVGDKQFTKYFLKQNSGFIAMSRQVEADLKTFEPDKPCFFNPHPLYDQFGEKKPREEALRNLGFDSRYKYILFFGLVRKYKGLDTLLRSLPLIERDDLRLIVAGEFYGDRSEYDELITELGIQDKVILHDKFIPDGEVANYFGAAELVCQPYKTATQSGVTQIAYHFEVPMVVTNVGGLPEIVPDGKVGKVVDSNPESLARGLQDALRDESLLEFRKHLPLEKKRFTWETMVQTIKNLWQKLS